MENTSTVPTRSNVATLVLLCLITLPAAEAAPRYSVTELSVLGSVGSTANGINDKGQVVGTYEGADGNLHPFRSAARGSRQGLTTLTSAGGRNGYGQAINQGGQIAGYRTLSDKGLRKLKARWKNETGRDINVVSQQGQGFRTVNKSPGIRLNLIPPVEFTVQTPDGETHALQLSSIVMGINDSGQLAGGAAAPRQQMHAFRSTGNGPELELLDLGTLGGRISIANGINGLGQVAGTSEITEELHLLHAFRSTGKGKAVRLKDLGTLGGDSSEGQGINRRGEVTGKAQRTDGSYHAFRSTKNGEPLALVDLGTLGGVNSAGVAINEQGIVVGHSDVTGDTFTHGFLYDGEMHDLNQLIAPGEWKIIDAKGINARNEISAVGTNAVGERRALLLMPGD